MKSQLLLTLRLMRVFFLSALFLACFAEFCSPYPKSLWGRVATWMLIAFLGWSVVDDYRRRARVNARKVSDRV